ncbi:MAG: toxin-antitoxin system HicB family antitoxin [Lamprobacter sp.]|uniref:toxin-antitoxin system HicB family antitoxin n=1 Tax=Lamprobacter sp. TaxID=3100796 RepID=UPI002B257117|nr:toxin-antitoxin system HicB family antitoxin [Lamprobacter sp.]MEA3640628.1 toxin-antitoxin system HicB family antitoxin [Lamprobacter sp.]
MSTLTINIPDSLAGRLRQIAQDQGITVDQLLSSAAAEKISAIMTIEHLQKRGARGDRAAYQRFLDSSPDVAPLPGDEL